MRQKLISLFLILHLLAGISAFIPEAHGQTYDNYAWYGYSGQGDWTVQLGMTHIWNSTDNAMWIGHDGYAIEYSTYCGTTMSYPQYYIKLKLARNGTIDNEFNIYYTDSTQNPIVNTRANYTLPAHVAVQEGDYIAYYSNQNPQIWDNVAGDDSLLYKNGDLTGDQVFSSWLEHPERLCIQILVGWDDPPEASFGSYLWHGFLIAGIILMTYAPIYTVKTIKETEHYENMTVALLVGFMAFMIGLGLFWTWITY